MSLLDVPAEVIQTLVMPYLSLKDLSNLRLTCHSLCRTVDYMLPRVACWRFYSRCQRDGGWERDWQSPLEPLSPITDDDLCWYLKHFPIDVCALQRTFVKAAHHGCVQALQRVYRRWQAHGTINRFLLELTVQVATRHACAWGQINVLRYLRNEPTLDPWVRTHGVRDNWEFCCFSGNSFVVRFWMDWHQLGRDALEQRQLYPVTAAALSGSLATVDLLVRGCHISGADMAPFFPNLLRRLVRRNLTHIIEYFFDLTGLNNLEFAARRADGVSELLMMALEENKPDCLRLFVQRLNVSLDEFEHSNCLLLQGVILMRNLPLLRLLVEDLAMPYTFFTRNITFTKAAEDEYRTAGLACPAPPMPCLQLLEDVCLIHQTPHIYTYVKRAYKSERHKPDVAMTREYERELSRTLALLASAEAAGKPLSPAEPGDDSSAHDLSGPAAAGDEEWAEIEDVATAEEQPDDTESDRDKPAPKRRP